MRVLGLETSCDETAVAVYDADAGLLAHEVYSQVELHAAYGFRTDRTAHAVYNLRTQKGTYLVGDEAALVSGGLLKDVQPEPSEIIEHSSLSHKW